MIEPFIKDQKFNSVIIVGSPDPHGEFKARARDGHHGIELAMFLGKYCNTPEHQSVIWDVDTTEKVLSQNNLIVIGGPVTNVVSAKINEKLPIRFSDTKPWGLVKGKEKYTEEYMGVISKIKNPFNENKQILFIAGIGNLGTKSCILALTKNLEEVMNKIDINKGACVVQGFDLDGDSLIDSVEVI